MLAGAAATSLPLITPFHAASAAVGSGETGGGGPGPVGGGSSTYATVVAASSPFLWWRLGEASGATANDSSATGINDGTVVGGVTWGVDGAVSDGNTAASFASNDGSSSISSPDYAALTDPFIYSIELWFHTTQSAALLATLHDGGNFDRSLHLVGGKIHLYHYGDGSYIGTPSKPGVNEIESPLAYNDGEWHHVVGTFSGSSTDGNGTATLFVDGEQVAQDTASVFNYSTPAHWIVGSAWGFAQFTGGLDEIAIYHGALPESVVSAHYDAR